MSLVLLLDSSPIKGGEQKGVILKQGDPVALRKVWELAMWSVITALHTQVLIEESSLLFS